MLNAQKMELAFFWPGYCAVDSFLYTVFNREFYIQTDFHLAINDPCSKMYMWQESKPATGLKGAQDFNVFHTHMPATLFGGEV